MSKSRKHEDTPWTVVDASPTENQQEPRTESASLECDDTSWKTLAKRLMSKHTKNVGSKPHESVDHPVAHDVAILKEKNTVRLPKVLFVSVLGGDRSWVFSLSGDSQMFSSSGGGEPKLSPAPSSSSGGSPTVGGGAERALGVPCRRG